MDNGREEGIHRKEGRESSIHSQGLAVILQSTVLTLLEFRIQYQDLISNILAKEKDDVSGFSSHMCGILKYALLGSYQAFKQVNFGTVFRPRSQSLCQHPSRQHKQSGNWIRSQATLLAIVGSKPFRKNRPHLCLLP